MDHVRFAHAVIERLRGNAIGDERTADPSGRRQTSGYVVVHIVAASDRRQGGKRSEKGAEPNECDISCGHGVAGTTRIAWAKEIAADATEDGRRTHSATYGAVVVPIECTGGSGEPNQRSGAQGRARHRRLRFAVRETFRHLIADD